MLDAGLYNMDCMDGMKQFPDGFFDLAIVDPPYGDGNSCIGGGTLWQLVRPIQGGTGSASASTATNTRFFQPGGTAEIL